MLYLASLVRMMCIICCSFGRCLLFFIFFFFNDTATTEIYTLSLHDALPIYGKGCLSAFLFFVPILGGLPAGFLDRKSTRLNSSHSQISYAVFCLKKKKIKQKQVFHCYYQLQVA